MKSLIIQDNPDTATHDFLLNNVLAQRPPDAPSQDRKSKPFAILEKNENDTIAAGLMAYVHPGWTYIDLLRVEESRRNQGLGQALMQRAEQEALARNCHSIWLWTQDFEAPAFYEKLGYTRFTTFENFIPGHQRIGYWKRIAT